MRLSIQTFLVASFVLLAAPIGATPKIPFSWPRKSCEDMTKVITSHLWGNIKAKIDKKPKAKIQVPSHENLRGYVAEYCAFYGMKEAFAGQQDVEIYSSVKFSKGNDVLAEVDIIARNCLLGSIDFYEVKAYSNVRAGFHRSKQQFANLKEKLDSNRHHPWPPEIQILVSAILFGDPSFHFMTYSVPFFAFNDSEVGYVPLPFSFQEIEMITKKVHKELIAFQNAY